jgi:hypothetical protein
MGFYGHFLFSNDDKNTQVLSCRMTLTNYLAAAVATRIKGFVIAVVCTEKSVRNKNAHKISEKGWYLGVPGAQTIQME